MGTALLNHFLSQYLLLSVNPILLIRNINYLFPFQLKKFAIERWFPIKQFGNTVQNKVGGYTIVMYCLTTIVHNKNKYFDCFCQLFVWWFIFYLAFLTVCVEHFSVVNSKTKIKIIFLLVCSQTRPILSVDCLFTQPFCCLPRWCNIYLGRSQPASKVSLNSNDWSNIRNYYRNIVHLDGYYCLLQA